MREQYISEPARRIPVIGSWDVVVCGGGPSGIMASIAAARAGSRTLLIEQYGFLGGMATSALVGPISKFNLKGQRIVSGLPEEFINRMAEGKGAIVDLPSGNVPYDPEIYKWTAQRMVLSEGVELLFHTRVTDCIEDPSANGLITHIIIENKSGRQAIESKYIIDCTGSGDVVGRTALPCHLRANADGEMQPLSLYFRLGGVDTRDLNILMAHDGTKYANTTMAEILQAEVDAGRLDNFGGPWVVHGSTIRPGEVSVNATRTRANATVGKQLSDAEIKLREDVFTILKVFKEKLPHFRHAYLIDTAVQVGIRETRAIDGLYTMDIEDILGPGHFEDTVALGGHPIDIHSTNTSDQNVRFIAEPYQIPYRSLIPKGSRNLLVAGGTISATRTAFASIRVQAQCMALGQAAGMAVSLCREQKIRVSELDGNYLRHKLNMAGAIT